MSCISPGLVYLILFLVHDQKRDLSLVRYICWILVSTLVSPTLGQSPHLLPSLCLKDFGPGRQCLRSVRRPLGVRVRMPRQSLSVILRGWHPLVTNQAEKSAIAVYWETASRSVPGSWCHPLASPFQGSLQRCQCIGCRPGRLSLLQRNSNTFHFNQFPCTGHHNCLHPRTTCSTHSLCGSHNPFRLQRVASVPENAKLIKSQLMIHHRKRSGHVTPYGPNLNTKFPISRRFGRYGQKTNNDAKRREARTLLTISHEPLHRFSKVRGAKSS